MADTESLQQLREAVALSPKNLPLRQALADALLSASQFAEAEAAYRAALLLAPDLPGLKLGLARVFQQLGKRSHALVLVEDLVQSRQPPAQAFLLHARLLAAMGEVAQAVEQYRRGVALDPTAADPEFAGRLGIRPAGKARTEEVAAEDDAGEEDADDDAEEWSEELEDVVDGRIRQGDGGEEGLVLPEIERPKLRFADVGGMEPLKEEIRLKIIYPITHAEMYRAYGKKVGGGILLYGPPGCGKTHLARATAWEIQAAFLSVGIHDVLDMWLGNSERNLHQVFEQARKNRPCVLFFDEVDALGASRADMKASAGRHLINQFLNELDGVNASNEGVLVLGATNAPWHLDAAFRRPGRFDRILFVPPPDAAGRVEVLRLQLQGKPLAEPDLEAVAAKCEGFSGADLKAVVDVTVENKLRESLAAGVPTPIRTRDLLAAVATLKPTTREWFATARNYALYSNQGGTYDDILKYLKL